MKPELLLIEVEAELEQALRRERRLRAALTQQAEEIDQLRKNQKAPKPEHNGRTTNGKKASGK